MAEVDIKVSVTRMVQLNKFEPYTVMLEETRTGVDSKKAESVRAKLHSKLMREADEAVQEAIKEYRER